LYANTGHAIGGVGATLHKFSNGAICAVCYRYQPLGAVALECVVSAGLMGNTLNFISF